MSRGFLLCLCSLLLLLVPSFSSKLQAITDGKDNVAADAAAAYIRLPSSSLQIDDGTEDGSFSYGSSSGVLTQESVGSVKRPSRPRPPPAPRPPPPRPPPPPPPPPSPPDNLILAISWPKAMATVTAVRDLCPSMFTIHGLWGTNQVCPRVTTDPNLFRDPLLSQLRQYWVNAKARTTTDYQAVSSALTFWLYEYQKHGGCTNLGQVAYFQNTMNMYLANDITRIVNSNYRFEVANGQRINTTELWGTINTGLNATTSMVCNANGVLQEIRLYLRTSQSTQTSNWTVVNYPGARACATANVVFQR